MHIAVIPDGNRRYMQKNGILKLKDSYERGIQKFFDFVEWSKELGVNEVTIYALSTENIENREKTEIKTLLNLFSIQSKKILNNGRLHSNKIQVNICGDLDFLSQKIQDEGLRKNILENFNNLEKSTETYSNMILNLAVSYGGRAEIVNAANKLIKSNLPITEENLKSKLWIKDYPDIILRTAESRLSNFLLFQGAYSEIYFINKLWQEFEKSDLEKILKDFNSKERRFGK